MTAPEVGHRPGRSLLTVPASGKGPGVLLLHAWWGLNDFVAGLATQLAQEGYVVLAPDLYDGVVVDKVKDAEAVSDAVDGERAMARVETALDQLRDHEAVTGDSVGVMAISFGAWYAMSVAAKHAADVGALVVFYGGTDADVPGMTAPVLAHFADQDPFEPLSAVELFQFKLAEAGVDASVHIYPGTHHWFFEADRPEFSEENAELAWSRTLEFLGKHLKV